MKYFNHREKEREYNKHLYINYPSTIVASDFLNYFLKIQSLQIQLKLFVHFFNPIPHDIYTEIITPELNLMFIIPMHI